MPLHGFDRIVSIEMFEHMRNWETLLGRVRSWLHDEGRFFAHVFAHRTHPYRFEDDKAEANNEAPQVKTHGNWMGEHFFSGGIMPSRDLFHQFSKELKVERDWWWDGRHYGRTSEHWLENLDRNRTEALKALQDTPGISPKVMLPLESVLHGMRGNLCVRPWPRMGCGSCQDVKVKKRCFKANVGRIVLHSPLSCSDAICGIRNLG